MADKITVSREKAIQIFDRASDQADPRWIDMMDDFGLYDKDSDTWPTIFDVFAALGVTKDEIDKSQITQGIK